MGMRSIWVLAVVCAFAAGSIMTGAAVFADDDDDGGGNIAIVTALNEIRDAILGITPTQTVTVQSIEGPQGPQGPRGFQGVQGPQGPVFDKYYVVSGFSNTPVSSLSAHCDTGDIVTGGGGSSTTAMKQNRPSEAGTLGVRNGGVGIGWFVSFSSPSIANVNAICADIAEPFRP